MKTVPLLYAQLGLLALVTGVLAGCGGPSAANAPLGPTATRVSDSLATAASITTTVPIRPVRTFLPAPIATGALPRPSQTAAEQLPTLTASPVGPYQTPTPWPTFPPPPAAGPDAAAWDAAQIRMAALQTYHRREVVRRGATESHLEVDLVLPYSMHVTSGDGSEYIAINGDWWEHRSAGQQPGVFDHLRPFGPLFEFDPAVGARLIANVQRAGEETIAGLPTIHYTFTFNSLQYSDVGVMVKGQGEAWIARDSGYFQRIRWRVAEEGGNSAIQWEHTLDFSRFNDPTIQIAPPNN
jgi:hypothetical protein